MPEEDNGTQHYRDALDLLKAVESADDLKAKREEFVEKNVEAMRLSVLDMKKIISESPENAAAMMFGAADGDERQQLMDAQDSEMERIKGLGDTEELIEEMAIEMAKKIEPHAQELAAAMGQMMGGMMGELGDAMAGGMAGMMGEEIPEDQMPSNVIAQQMANAAAAPVSDFDVEAAIADDNRVIVAGGMCIEKFGEITDSERFKERTEAALNHMMEAIVVGTQQIEEMIPLTLEEKREALLKQKADAEKNEAFMAAMEQEFDRFSKIEGLGMAEIMFLVQRMEARGEPLTTEMTVQLKNLLVSMGGDDGVPSEEDYQLVYDAYAGIVGGEPLIAINCELKGEEPPPSAYPEDVFCKDCGLRQMDPSSENCPECGTKYGEETEAVCCVGCSAVKLPNDPCVICGGTENKPLPKGCDKCGYRLPEDYEGDTCEGCLDED